MFAGGVALLAGLLYLGSRFLEKPHGESSISEEVAAINASRAKEDDERRQRQETEAKNEQDQRRADEVARITKILSLNVCDGDDQVAGELAKTLVSISEDLASSFENGNLPKNLPAYVEQKLMTQMTENAVLRHWFGKRSPQVFAHSVATLMFGTRSLGAGNQVNPMPDFLASGRYGSMGSGFFISADGLFLTNQHVVKNLREVDVRIPSGQIVHAKVLKTNPSSDIAVAKVDVRDTKWLPLSNGPATMGSSVFTIGFPKPDLQGVEPKFTDGRISSLSGIRDEAGVYQISVPVQHGNSGGPLVHMDTGWIVGMIRSKLNMDADGDIPQNVNYAIKSTVIREFMGSIPEAKGVFDTVPELPKTQAEIIDLVKSSIGLVLVPQ
jgi:S1-C subfamily serine protease